MLMLLRCIAIYANAPTVPTASRSTATISLGVSL